VQEAGGGMVGNGQSEEGEGRGKTREKKDMGRRHKNGARGKEKGRRAVITTPGSGGVNRNLMDSASALSRLIYREPNPG